MKSLSLIVAALLLTACGPAVYTQADYTQPIYDPSLAVVYVNGIHGYYGYNHIFYPSIAIGGVYGYYNSSHVFVSASPAVRSQSFITQNRTQFYRGPGTSAVSRQSTGNGYGNPRPGTMNGTMGRSGLPAASTNRFSGSGSSGLGSSTRSVPAAPAPSRPSSSMSGSMSRRRR